MDELINIANELKFESEMNLNQFDFNKYNLILEVLNTPNWLFQVKSEYAIKILEDLKFESPQDKYVELALRQRQSVIVKLIETLSNKIIGESDKKTTSKKTDKKSKSDEKKAEKKPEL